MGLLPFENSITEKIRPIKNIKQIKYIILLRFKKPVLLIFRKFTILPLVLNIKIILSQNIMRKADKICYLILCKPYTIPHIIYTIKTKRCQRKIF